jgi:hypothetical protein
VRKGALLLFLGIWLLLLTQACGTIGQSCEPLQPPVVIKVGKDTVYANECRTGLVKHQFFAPSKVYPSPAGAPTLKDHLVDTQIKEVQLFVPGTMRYIDFLRVDNNIRLSAVDRIQLQIDGKQVAEYGVFLGSGPQVEARTGQVPDRPNGYEGVTVEYRAELPVQMYDIIADLARISGSKVRFNYYDVF